MTTEQLTQPEQLDVAFLEDLFGRMVGSTIKRVAAYSETHFYLSLEKDGTPTEVLIGIEDGELVVTEGELLEKSNG